MNKITSYIIMAASVLTLASCNDWLDVQPETEVRESDLFTSYKGYKEALAGCYTAMVSRDIYGEKLTMSDVECLANLWNTPSSSNFPALYYLHNHKYDDEYARRDIKTIYSSLYNVIVQSNAIIGHITADPTTIADTQARNVVEAEARAIRAFCHFDVLRLFGQMPANAQKTVSLPYSETYDIKTLPPYYNFNDFVKKLFQDLDIAEEKLAASDPIMEYSFAQLLGTGDNPADLEDDFLMYRRYRFNYWAVKALKARIYLYIGDKANAYKEAKSIIDAKLNGEKVVNLTSDIDTDANYNALPHECLFALQNSAMLDYSVTLLGGDVDKRVDNSKQLLLTTTNFEKKLFAGANTASDVRYLKQWERGTMSSQGTKYPTLKKYYYSTKTNHSTLVLRTCLQIVPMLRLSEMYLIAMETTNSLDEANSLYKTYMAARKVNVTVDFTSKDEMDIELENEYRREFYGEGQMFFFYKRLAKTSMMFSWEDMGEEQYVIPLPDTEFNPAQ